jgi:Tyrosine phosphatase family
MDSPASFKLLEGSITATERPTKKKLNLLSKQCDTIITLLWETETPSEVSDLCNQMGLDWVWFPIKAVNYLLLSKLELFNSVLEKLLELKQLLIEGKNILIHCAAGIHRTGFVVYSLLRLSDYPHNSAIDAISVIRPKILQNVGKHRIEVAKSFYEKLLGEVVYVPFIQTFGMVETDWVKPALAPLIWVKVLFSRTRAKVSFCITSTDLYKMVVGTDVFLDFTDDLPWKSKRMAQIDDFPPSRSFKECEEIIKGFICSSTKKSSTMIAGTSCFLDKEFITKYIPGVLDDLRYRIIDLSIFNEIKSLETVQTMSIYEDINNIIELKRNLLV